LVSFSWNGDLPPWTIHENIKSDTNEASSVTNNDIPSNNLKFSNNKYSNFHRFDIEAAAHISIADKGDFHPKVDNLTSNAFILNRTISGNTILSNAQVHHIVFSDVTVLDIILNNLTVAGLFLNNSKVRDIFFDNVTVTNVEIVNSTVRNIGLNSVIARNIILNSTTQVNVNIMSGKFQYLQEKRTSDKNSRSASTSYSVPILFESTTSSEDILDEGKYRLLNETQNENTILGDISDLTLSNIITTDLDSSSQCIDLFLSRYVDYCEGISLVNFQNHDIKETSLCPCISSDLGK